MAGIRSEVSPVVAWVVIAVLVVVVGMLILHFTAGNGGRTMTPQEWSKIQARAGVPAAQINTKMNQKANPASPGAR